MQFKKGDLEEGRGVWERGLGEGVHVEAMGEERGRAGETGRGRERVGERSRLGEGRRGCGKGRG